MTHVESEDTASMDRMDAAQILLGVSPNTTVTDLSNTSTFKGIRFLQSASPIASLITSSRSGGLDALAALATSSLEEEHFSGTVIASGTSSSSSSDDEDSEAMPPPPPRGRARSCSNPEGMDKWDTLSTINERKRYVLPDKILEKELAEAKAAAKLKEEENLRDAITITTRSSSFSHVETEREEDSDREDILRRARNRLLEDLSEGSITGEKGQLTLPHAMAKYKHVYNKNGRIGIYTPEERSAIIARFQSKRARRVWNKKIRYNCRKSLADRRLRVKGRFVKQLEVIKADDKKQDDEQPFDEDMPDVNDPEAGFAPTPDMPYRRLRRHTIT